MAAKTSTAARIASIREEYDRCGENVDHLSDLELLNEYVERRDRERIDISDRYMRLLIEQRRHGERVRASTIAGMRERIDILATQAVSRKAGEVSSILGAIEVLPERASAERVELLKRMAASTRHTLRLIGESEAQDPAKSWRLDDNRGLVSAVRNVVGVLRGKEGVSAADVIRLVSEALAPNGNLRDLFDVGNAAPIKREMPAFAGDGWTEMGGGSYWTFEPASSLYRVVAYNQGDTWWIDLQGPSGALIAAGETSEDMVAVTAQALIEQAPEFAKSDLRPWQCWQRATEQLAPERAAA